MLTETGHTLLKNIAETETEALVRDQAKSLSPPVLLYLEGSARFRMMRERDLGREREIFPQDG